MESIEKEYQKVTKKYAKDYFDEHTKELIENCLLFIHAIKTGEFEYDTALGDGILMCIKHHINEIDI